MRVAAGAVIALLVVRAILGGALGLSGDEAYYWTWSEALAWGYFDHPPGVAATIRLGTTLFGDTEFGVRIGGLVLQSAAWIGLLWAARTREERWLLALLLLGLPVLAFGGLLATPDALLLAAWGGALVAFERDHAVLAGALVGVAILAKLTGVLLVPALLLAGWGQPRRLQVTLAMAAVVAAPWAWWNLSGGGGDVLFQLQHGLGTGDGAGLWGSLEFLGGQAAAAGPVIFLAGLAWLLTGRRDLWWWSAAIPLALFGLAAARGPSEINWAATAWIGASVALSRSTGTLRRAAWAGGWISAGITGLVMLHAAYPIWQTPGPDPVDRLRQGEVLGPAVEAWGQPVLTARYQEAAWVRFYGGVDATTCPGVHREDQFDRWPRELPEAGVYVRPAGWPGPAEAGLFYRDVSGPARVVARRGDRVIGAWEVWQVAELRDRVP